MSKSRTRFTTFRHLAIKEELSNTIARLMMACNDLTLAEDALATWREEQPATREIRKTGAGMYFIRLQIAHIYEALSIIKEIRDANELSRALAHCDRRTRDSFDELEKFMRTEYYKKMCRIRNNVTFHYDKKLVGRALAAEANSQPETPLTMSLGQNPVDWYFEPADHIVNRIVVLEIFDIPPSASFLAEVDKILALLQGVQRAFSDFAGHFIWHYAGRR